MEMIDKLIEDLRAIDYSNFTEEYVDDILDNRDNDPFDSEWCRVYDEINELKNKKSYTNDHEEGFLKYSQLAWKILYDNNCSDLSPYVADDLGMIYDIMLESGNDDVEYDFVATQEDMNNF